MNPFHLLAFACIVSAACSTAQALPASKPCWVELPQKDGTLLSCDLSSASMVRFTGNSVTLEIYFPVKNQVFAQVSEAAAAQKVRQLISASIEHWVQINGAVEGETGFLNLSMVIAVRFGADYKGSFARVLTRGDSIVPMEAKDQYSGWEVRDPASLQRLKSCVTPSS